MKTIKRRLLSRKHRSRCGVRPDSREHDNLSRDIRIATNDFWKRRGIDTPKFINWGEFSQRRASK